MREWKSEVKPLYLKFFTSRLFACYNDGVINLLEKYFDMQKKGARDALGFTIYLYKQHFNKFHSFLILFILIFLFRRSLQEVFDTYGPSCRVPQSGGGTFKLLEY